MSANIKRIREKQLHDMEFRHREQDFQHYNYREEMLTYEYLKKGDMASLTQNDKLYASSQLGRLSGNPIRNLKYLFVASTTLATRFAVEGGMDEEVAYNASDLYIQEMDTLKEEAEIRELQKEMLTFFTQHIAQLKKRSIHSKPIVIVTDYIYAHLNTTIRICDLAEQTQLNPSYLSTLFKKEMGMTISDYIKAKRIETAKNMLKFSDYSYAQISSNLAYSSQSYFIQVFKDATGVTPKQYRDTLGRE